MSATPDMIERAARALWERNGRPMHAHDQVAAMSAPEPIPDWQRYIDDARAVLAAMREPDPSFWRKVTSYGNVAESNARALWQHMIDAALEDGR